MSPRTKKVNAEIRQAAVDNFLAASLKVFCRKGYHASSMQDIANEAGVSKGLFYHYFLSKEDILVQLVEARLQRWTPLVEGLEATADVNKRFLFLVNFVLEELEAKTLELRFFNALYLSEEGVLAIAKGLRKFDMQFERLFLQERRLFSDLGYLEAEIEATFFRSILQGISLEYMLGPEIYPLQKMKEILMMRYVP